MPHFPFTPSLALRLGALLCCLHAAPVAPSAEPAPAQYVPAQSASAQPAAALPCAPDSPPPLCAAVGALVGDRGTLHLHIPRHDADRLTAQLVWSDPDGITRHGPLLDTRGDANGHADWAMEAFATRLVQISGLAASPDAPDARRR